MARPPTELILLDPFERQMFVLIYILNFTLPQAVQFFDQLFEEMSKVTGYRMKVPSKQWQGRKEKWAQKWKVGQGRSVKEVSGTLEGKPLWYDGESNLIRLPPANGDHVASLTLPRHCYNFEKDNDCTDTANTGYSNQENAVPTPGSHPTSLTNALYDYSPNPLPSSQVYHQDINVFDADHHHHPNIRRDDSLASYDLQNPHIHDALCMPNYADPPLIPHLTSTQPACQTHANTTTPLAVLPSNPRPANRPSEKH